MSTLVIFAVPTILAFLAYILFGAAGEPDVNATRLKNQSVVIPTKDKDSTATYRNLATPRNTPLVTCPSPSVETAYDMLQHTIKKLPNQNFLGKRINDGPYVWETYGSVAKRITDFGSGLIGLCHLETKDTTMVGIFLKNSPEWLITDHTCAAYSLVSVPMYDTFDESALKFIINHVAMSVVVSSSTHVGKLLNMAGEAPTLKTVVITDVEKISAEMIERASALKLSLKTMKEVEKYGNQNPVNHAPPKPDTLMTICYTSGTTGTPKGVMLTHMNMTSAVAALNVVLPKGKKISEKDRHLSYLPLSHMFERVVSGAMSCGGASVGFFRGDILKLFGDIEVLQPTIFPSVPRLLSRLYDKIQAGVSSSSPLKKLIFETAFNAKKKMLRAGIVSTDTFWDKLVFKKLQAKLGGHVRFMMTGAAPISSEIIEFLRIVFGCNVIEGYGQTETTATGSCTMYGDYQFAHGSHIGVPFSNIEMKLADAPAMNYTSQDKPNPRGEICFRGPSIMKGYYKEEKKTAETIDKDGWLHTGDVGEIMPNGTLKIIDRVKNIFKLSQGEYVAPEKIEMKIKTSHVLQAFVHGESLKACLVAVIVPDPETAIPWAKDVLKLKAPSMLELCHDPAFKKALLAEIHALGIQNELHKFELPKDIVLIEEPFSVENELLTPTFKAKRVAIQRKYQDKIDEMYKHLD